MADGAITLKGGRTLGYKIYGSGEAQPVLYFHGAPSSRLEPLLLYEYGVDLEEILAGAGLKLIAVDRPGKGLSSFDASASFFSFADDVKELCAALAIKQCPVMCWSGGGPYALAVAFKHPYLIHSVHIICGFTRRFAKDVTQLMGMNKWYFILAKQTPWILRAAMNLLKRQPVKRRVPQWITGLPYVDYSMLKEVSHFNTLANLTMKEACRNNADGPVQEARNYYKDPGFRLEDIKQVVHYWWGSMDMSVIRLHAEEVEQKAPNAVMHYREGEGHLSLYVRHFKEVLQTIRSVY